MNRAMEEDGQLDSCRNSSPSTEPCHATDTGVSWTDRDDERGMKASGPSASGIAPERVVVQRLAGDARRRDLLTVSKIRTEFVAILVVSESAPRKRTRIGA